MESLAEDLTQLLMRHTELLLAYLGADSLRHVGACVSGHRPVLTTGLLEAKVQ